MKLIIAGGRAYVMSRDDHHFLDEMHKEIKATEVVSGHAPGADQSGEGWASLRGIPIKTFKADWARWGRSAGPKRNQRRRCLPSSSRIRPRSS